MDAMDKTFKAIKKSLKNGRFFLKENNYRLKNLRNKKICIKCKNIFEYSIGIRHYYSCWLMKPSCTLYIDVKINGNCIKYKKNKNIWR